LLECCYKDETNRVDGTFYLAGSCLPGGNVYWNYIGIGGVFEEVFQKSEGLSFRGNKAGVMPAPCFH